MGDSHKVPFFYNLMNLLKFNHSEQVSLSETKLLNKDHYTYLWPYVKIFTLYESRAIVVTAKVQMQREFET